MRAAAMFPSPEGMSIQPDGMHGCILFQDVSSALCRVSINLQGLRPHGVYAIHVHEGAFLSESDLREGCGKLGGHFNPTQSQHGSLFFHGYPRHAGDLCNNIFADERGTVSLTYLDDILRVSSAHFTPIGHSVVIHEYADDLGIGGVLTNSNGKLTTPRAPVDFLGLRYTPYSSLDAETLGFLQQERYPHTSSFGAKDIARRFASETSKTGNAGGRLACSNIYRV